MVIGAVELHIDRDRCVGAGMCALTAPHVFDQDPNDGRVRLIERQPEERSAKDLQAAAALCPTGALRLRPAHEPRSSSDA